MWVRYLSLAFVLCLVLLLSPCAYAQEDMSLSSTNLSELQNRYLDQCDNLNVNSRRVQYQISRISFYTLDEVKQYADSLDAIQAHLNTELSQCSAFGEVSSTLSTVRNLVDIAVKSREVKLVDRSLFFYYEGVADIYRDDIELQIRDQIDIVQRIFEEELDLSLGRKSLVFFITNRRIMEKDVGGANIGSFIWLPLEFSLGYGQQWPDGVRESTVRHEIVHAFMNHVSTSPIEHAYPKVFIEGIALYLSDNRIIEFHRRTQVRLSDEYIDFLRTFEYMEERAGRDAVLSFIRDMLTGTALNFSDGFQNLTGTSYAEHVAAQPAITERAFDYIQNTLRIPRKWQRYISVFGALGILSILFLTVQLPETKREEVRRNISIAFLTFIIIAFLTQGQLVELAAKNYFAFILLSLFIAVLLRGYPYVRHEDLMKDLQDRSVDYWEEDDLSED